MLRLRRFLGSLETFLGRRNYPAERVLIHAVSSGYEAQARLFGPFPLGSGLSMGIDLALDVAEHPLNVAQHTDDLLDVEPLVGIETNREFELSRHGTARAPRLARMF
jgi:hypothetical protein